MTRWSDIPFSPPARTLRQFTGLWLAFFAGLAVTEAFRHGPGARAGVCVALALALGPLGLWKPLAVRPVYVGALVLTFPLAWAVSTVVLAAVFYGVFTPLGLVMRLCGRDALRLRPDPGAGTYWEPRPGPPPVRRYFCQF
jgi:hypothetical protein